ncbi:hypothetical protein [Niastella sp. OAS944]|uniref:hypothetical protein n=1 Tax=Niastella sp. OAS944 TaxID=2664089 RepID=UPI003484E167|nr:hypothetical protein [Chitinophagaceae bacterium OAS944]
MNKLILPILLGIFMLSFSGKPAPFKKCGPHITIDNPAGIGVFYVEVINIASGITTTYQNPTFPFYHGSTNGNGGQYGVRFTFDRESDGVLNLNGNPVENFREKGDVEVWFNAWCEEYNVSLTN